MAGPEDSGVLDLSVEVLDCRLRDLMVLQDEVEAHAAVVEEIVQAQGATPWSGEGSASGCSPVSLSCGR